MISRILAGYFAGATMTLGFSYFTNTSILYVEELNRVRIGTKMESERIRNYLFAIFSFAFNLGFIIGPGKQSELACFKKIIILVQVLQ